MRPNDQKPLSAGMRITPQRQRTSGVLGALAADRGGKVYGLTARHVLSHGISTVVLDGQQRILANGADLGRSRRSLSRSPMPLACFASVPPVWSMRLMEGYGRFRRLRQLMSFLVKGFARWTHVVGFQPLSRVCMARSGWFSRQVGHHCDTWGQWSWNLRRSRGFSAQGDAGALVLTEAGQQVGILIAGSGRRYFVAPLMPVLQDHKLRLLTAQDAAIHNDNARKELAKPTPSVDQITMQFLAELRNLRGSNADLTVIKRMSSSAPWRDERPSALAEALGVL